MKSCIQCRIEAEFNSHISKPQTQEVLDRELRKLRNNIQKINNGSSLLMKWTGRRTEAVDTQMRLIANQFSNEIIRAEIECQPYWNQEQPTGRLNMNRAIKSYNNDFADLDKVFDKWEVNDKDSDFEAVIMIDNSGSMGGSMLDVCRSAWIIKKAFDSINAETTVITFSTTSKILYESGEKVSPTDFRYVGADSDTCPRQGLIESRRLFNNSDKPNKVLFVLTDGQWSDSEDSNREILRLKQEGVLVVFVGFRLTPCGDWVKRVGNIPDGENEFEFKKHSPDSNEYQVYYHYSDIIFDIRSLDMLPKLAKDVVTGHFMRQASAH